MRRFRSSIKTSSVERPNDVLWHETTPFQLKQEDAKKKRLAAAAAAYVAVHVKGRAVVSLKDADAVILGMRCGEY